MRPSHRRPDEMRPVRITAVYPPAEGSVLIEFGDTRVLCTASVEESVPGFCAGAGLADRRVRHAAAFHPHPQRSRKRPAANKAAVPRRSSG